MTAPQSAIANSATFSILAYCSSSILMTVTNKMVLSRFDFNMNFLLLTIQVKQSSMKAMEARIDFPSLVPSSRTKRARTN